MAGISRIISTEAATVKKGTKIAEAARLIIANKHCCAVVVENDAPIGMVTDVDIIRHILSKGKKLNAPVSTIMSPSPATLDINMKINEALRVMDSKKFRRYPVLKDGKLAGIITKKDVVNTASDNIRMHRNIQNIVLVLFVLFQLFVFVVYGYVERYL